MICEHLKSTALTRMTKNEAGRRAAEESKQEAEARCAALQDTTDRLEGDLARLTAQARRFAPAAGFPINFTTILRGNIEAGKHSL